MLKWKQSLSLDEKINLSKDRIIEWYENNEGNVFVSFSGGKDSTVLLDIVRSIYPSVPAVFVDTGLEFPEIKDFARTVPNVIWLKPRLTFKQVIEKYGYPVISKVTATTIRKLTTQNLSKKYRNKLLHGDERGNAGKLAEKNKYLLDAPFRISEQCCDVMKKKPIENFRKLTESFPFVGTMACDSDMRKRVYNKHGCNMYNTKNPTSTPLSFWLEKDIWNYIKQKNILYSSIYDRGYDRTGCMFCMFGLAQEQKNTGENRFQKMKVTHPKQYDYCIHKLGCGAVLDFMNFEY